MSLQSIQSKTFSFIFFFIFTGIKNFSDKFSEDINLLWNFENSANQYEAKGGTSQSSILEQINFLKSWIRDQTLEYDNT